MINRLNYAPKLLHGLAHFGPIILIFEFLLIFSKKIYRFLVPIHPSGHYILRIHEKDTFLEMAKNSDFFVEGNWVDHIGSNFANRRSWSGEQSGKVWADLVNSITLYENIKIFDSEGGKLLWLTL